VSMSLKIASALVWISLCYLGALCVPVKSFELRISRHGK
jgi:hypothetical protein